MNLSKQHSGQSHAHLICIAEEISIQTCGRDEDEAVGGGTVPIVMSHTVCGEVRILIRRQQGNVRLKKTRSHLFCDNRLM